jgi:hypothetical protein
MGLKDNTRYEVLTEEGFKNFSGIKETHVNSTLEIMFTDGTILECTDGHLIKKNSEFIPAKLLSVGDIISDKTICLINKKENHNTAVYDLLDVEDTSSYITNDVVSHNCAFLLNWEEFFASVYPTISSGKETKILLTSTPNSLNHFWKICKEAQENIAENNQGKNGYIHFEVPWTAVPGRDEAWKEDTLASISWNMEQFEQEFNCAFVGSQNTLISGSKLKELSFTIPIMEREGIKQYKTPIKGNSYVLVADVSRGKGLDYSTFSILDVTKMPYEQVCTFRDNYVGPIDYANIIFRIAKLYNTAQVLIEINDIGGQVADTLFMEYGYEDMLSTENAGRSGKRISGGFGKNVDRGIRTTKSVKSVGCSILKLLIEQNQLIIPDFDTIQELARFSRRGSSYEAESGAHDDMVMTLVLFAWLSDQNYFKDMTDINTLMKLREKTEDQMDEYLLPFGFVDDGSEYEFEFPSVRNW